MNRIFFVYFFFLCCLIISSCAFNPSKISHSFLYNDTQVTVRAWKPKEQEVILGDIEQLLDILVKFQSYDGRYQNRLNHFMNNLQNLNITIDYSSYHCRSDMVSCVFANSDTIYLNAQYLELNEISRLSALVHELHHRFYPDRNHTLCLGDHGQPKRQWCDENLQGAYGIEYIFLTSLMHFADEFDFDSSLISSLLEQLSFVIISIE